MNKPTRKTILVIIAIVLASLLISAAIAASIIWSNTVTLIPIEVTLILKANTTTPYLGETVHFNATLTGTSDRLVTFYINDDLAGSNTTINGFVTWDCIINSTVQHQVKAKCTV